MPARPSDPAVGFSFGLDLAGQAKGLFTEVSGLSSENEVIEHKAVDPKGINFIQKIPGRLKYGDITLKRGVTADMDMWTWRAQVEAGNITGARVNATITMFDSAFTPIAKWDLTNAWPSKVSGPSMNSDSNAFVVEELTIVCEAMVRSL